MGDSAMEFSGTRDVYGPSQRGRNYSPNTALFVIRSCRGL